MRKLSLVLTCVCLLHGGAAAAQTAVPVRFVAVSEAQNIDIYMKKGAAKAPAGARLVLVTFRPSDSLQAVMKEDLGLIGGGMSHTAAAIGDVEKGYCPTAGALRRKEAGFTGECLSGRVQTMAFTGPDLTAAFIVDSQVQLASLSLVFWAPAGDIAVQGTDFVNVANNLSMKVAKFSAYPQAGVVADLAVRNNGTAPVPVATVNFRLMMPGLPSWRLAQGFLYDRTGIDSEAKDGEGKRARSTDVAPGETRIVRLNFIAMGSTEGEAAKSHITYFHGYLLPLKPI